MLTYILNKLNQILSYTCSLVSFSAKNEKSEAVEVGQHLKDRGLETSPSFQKLPSSENRFPSFLCQNAHTIVAVCILNLDCEIRLL